MTTRPQPLRRIAAIAILRAKVELDRQFQVMHAVAVTQQHVEFAEGVPGAADWQVGGDQFDARRMRDGELPKTLVIQTQTAGARLRQPLQQAITVVVELAQPVFQALRVLYPVAAGERMALRPRCSGEHRRREDHPRQVPHFGMA